MNFKYKEFIVGIIIGGVIFGSASIFANDMFNISPNPFKIKVNGIEKSIDGYNINGSSYFKLRDIGEQVGFNVDFKNNTILIEKDNDSYVNNKEVKMDGFKKILDDNGEYIYTNYDGSVVISNDIKYYRWSYFEENGLLKNIYLHPEIIDNQKNIYNLMLIKKSDDSILLENIDYTMYGGRIMIPEQYFNDYILPLDK